MRRAISRISSGVCAAASASRSGFTGEVGKIIGGSSKVNIYGATTHSLWRGNPALKGGCCVAVGPIVLLRAIRRARHLAKIASRHRVSSGTPLRAAQHYSERLRGNTHLEPCPSASPFDGGTRLSATSSRKRTLLHPTQRRAIAASHREGCRIERECGRGSADRSRPAVRHPRPYNRGAPMSWVVGKEET